MMYLRKYFFTLTVIMFVFLFIAGSGILYYVKNVEANIDNGENNEETKVDDTENDKTEDEISDGIVDIVKDKNSFNMLILVLDKEKYNTDTIMLLNFSPKTERISLLSIPRDTRVTDTQIEYPKINSLYSRGTGNEGLDLLVSSLSRMLNVNIRYCTCIEIDIFKEIVDKLGGVEIDVPVDMDYEDPEQGLYIHLKKGLQLLDGEKAEQYCRFRKPQDEEDYTEEFLKYYDGSDLCRIKAQQNFVKELIRQNANIMIGLKLGSILETVFDKITTNMPSKDAIDLIEYIPSFSLGNFNFFTFKEGEIRKFDGEDFYILDNNEVYNIISNNFSGSGSMLD